MNVSPGSTYRFGTDSTPEAKGNDNLASQLGPKLGMSVKRQIQPLSSFRRWPGIF